MKKVKSNMMLLAFFINEKDRSRLDDILSSYNPILKFSCKGKAMGETSGDFWGFNVVERDVVFALAEREKADDILNLAHNLLNLNERHRGLALSMPIKSASSLLFEMFNKGEVNEK